MRLSLLRLLTCLSIFCIGFAVPAAAMSVEDFSRRSTQEESAPFPTRRKTTPPIGNATPMSVETFMRLSQEQKDELVRTGYFDGFRDALYDFNAVLQSVQTLGVEVFCLLRNEQRLSSTELMRRIDARIARERKFAAVDPEASLGLIALEVLSEAHRCPDEKDFAPQR